MSPQNETSREVRAESWDAVGVPKAERGKVASRIATNCDGTGASKLSSFVLVSYLKTYMFKPKYFLYARKSSEDDGRQVKSIEAQLFELRELARKENLEILAEFQESKSAKTP